MQADLLILPDPGGDPYEALLATRRNAIQAVVLAGRPVLVDPALAAWQALYRGQVAWVTIDDELVEPYHGGQRYRGGAKQWLQTSPN
jgi:hypothetical protein